MLECYKCHGRTEGNGPIFLFCPDPKCRHMSKDHSIYLSQDSFQLLPRPPAGFNDWQIEPGYGWRISCTNGAWTVGLKAEEGRWLAARHGEERIRCRSAEDAFAMVQRDGLPPNEIEIVLTWDTIVEAKEACAVNKQDLIKAVVTLTVWEIPGFMYARCCRNEITFTDLPERPIYLVDERLARIVTAVAETTNMQSLLDAGFVLPYRFTTARL